MAVETGTDTVKRGLAQMLKGGVIMDVVTPEHARIAEEAGACAVMALERGPADIRGVGGAPPRIGEGAAMIRTKGEAGTGDIVEAVRHMRAVWDGIRRLQSLPEGGLLAEGKGRGGPPGGGGEWRRLRVVNFAAGGVATPADAALMMQLGADGVFVGSGIFKSADPAPRARAVVKAVTNYNDPAILAEVSRGLGEPRKGLGAAGVRPGERLGCRGWPAGG